MTKFGFIRHGSTQWNTEGKAQGWSDIPLNNEGIEDANRLADRLYSEDWDIIYSSDLLRAHQTANIIAAKLQKEVTLDGYVRLQEG